VCVRVRVRVCVCRMKLTKRVNICRYVYADICTFVYMRMHHWHVIILKHARPYVVYTKSKEREVIFLSFSIAIQDNVYGK